MVPSIPRSGRSTWRRPRARGDGSHGGATPTHRKASAPRTRGWFPHPRRLRVRAGVGPAHAGMVLRLTAVVCRVTRRPRARGDGSIVFDRLVSSHWSAPRTRGWFWTRCSRSSTASVGPAHAGMVRRSALRHDPRCSRPRARGDGSTPGDVAEYVRTSAPRTRGWFRVDRALHGCHEVGPAHAGMVPLQLPAQRRGPRRPRARGDGSWASSATRRNRPSAPRTRGWFRLTRAGRLRVWSAPRTRGWFAGDQEEPRGSGVGPAHAGMVRRRRRARHDSKGRPRARGDGSASADLLITLGASAPRTRGWFILTHHCGSAGVVGPAHAGMVPGARPRTGRPSSRPRARGDGSQ